MIKWRKVGWLCAAAALPALAGGMYLEVLHPDRFPEAVGKKALIVAQIAACTSPEKTMVRATAELAKGGQRTSLPLRVEHLAAPDKFAVLPPASAAVGNWVLKVTATNPEYTNFTAAMVAPIKSGAVDWNDVKRYRHEPTETELVSALEGKGAGELTAQK